MASAASPELVWQMIRNNHGALMKARNIRRPFSKVGVMHAIIINLAIIQAGSFLKLITLGT